MSYNRQMGTITVDDVTYDVETESTNFGQRYTLSFDGEAMFEGLAGRCENEEYIDENDNPRQDSNVGTMAVSYRGYNLGDEDISDIEFVKPCPTCNGDHDNWVVGLHVQAERLVVGSKEECQAWLDAREDAGCGRYYIEPIAAEPGYVKWDGDPGHTRYEDGTMTCPDCGGEGEIPDNPVDYFRRERGARVVIGLTVYEHSGITMYAGDVTLGQDSARWDTSFVGYMFDTPEQLAETMGANVTDEQITEALKGEVKHYASYLEGDVTWFKVVDDETDFDESCGGFVGCRDEAEDEMYGYLEQALIKRIAEEAERLYWLDREVLTV